MKVQFRLLNYIAAKSFDRACVRHLTHSSKLCNQIDENVQNWKPELHETMQIFPNFISKEEEDNLMQEIDPYMKRLRYEYSHWDNAIHGYRETEKRNWNEKNMKVFDRVREKAFPKEMTQLALIHVLDLAEKGWIKPHVDSVRFCGEIIAGLSLLTDCVMRLTMVGAEQTCRDDFLLPRRSLYIMSGAARYKYNHEILSDKESYYEGQHVPKGRRISVICRCAPDSEKK